MISKRGFAEYRCGQQIYPGGMGTVRTLKQCKASGTGDMIIVDVDPVIAVKAQFGDPDPIGKADNQCDQNKK